jgi:type IV pilus assembly protein PilP
MKPKIVAAIAIIVLTGGCAKQEMGDLQQFVERVKQREPGQIEPLPEIKQIETYVYEADERRSPFKLGSRSVEETLAQPSNGIAPDPLRRKEELEQYPLDSIRMVGTLDQQEENWGLLIIKDGTLFRVRAGNYLGQNHGQITRISEERIQLTEIVPDGQGGWQERQASIALKE